MDQHIVILSTSSPAQEVSCIQSVISASSPPNTPFTSLPVETHLAPGEEQGKNCGYVYVLLSFDAISKLNITFSS